MPSCSRAFLLALTLSALLASFVFDRSIQRLTPSLNSRAATPRYAWSYVSSRLLLFRDGIAATDAAADAAWVKECLRGRHIVLVGDSLLRLQYLSLAQWWVTNSWTSAPPPISSTKDWPSWLDFHKGTTARLKGPTTGEVADTFRYPKELYEDKDDSRWIHASIENRYFRDAAHDFELDYLQMWGNLGIRGHEIEFMNATCKRGTVCTQAGCAPGECKGTHWSVPGNPSDVLWKIANMLRPDTIIINSGLWNSWAEPDKIISLIAGGEWAREAGVRELWWRMSSPRRAENQTQAREVWRNEREVLAPALRAASWQIHDSHSPFVVADFGDVDRAQLYIDNAHLTEDGNAAMNGLLLSQLMRGCPRE